MKAKTYEEWKLLGYHVMKGEKATGRNKQDEATFAREQVDDADAWTDAVPDQHLSDIDFANGSDV